MGWTCTGFPGSPARMPDARAHPGRRPSFARRPTPEPGVSLLLLLWPLWLIRRRKRYLPCGPDAA